MWSRTVSPLDVTANVPLSVPSFGHAALLPLPSLNSWLVVVSSSAVGVLLTGKWLTTLPLSKMHFAPPAPGKVEVKTTFLVPLTWFSPLVLNDVGHGKPEAVIRAGPRGVVVLHAPPPSSPVEDS